MPNNQMPHNLDAETALLGCILIDESIQSDVLEMLKEEDFYQESHREIVAGMKAVYGGRKPVDLITLADYLEREGRLERAGGLDYITELTQAVPSSANYRQYLEIVRRDSINRALIQAAGRVIENSVRSPEERDAVEYAEKQIYSVSQRGDSSALMGLADGEAVAEVIGKLEAIQNDPNAFRGLETGFKHLDAITHGLQKGNLIIIAARPGMGKTSLAMNIVEYACLKRRNVAAVFSLEMPHGEILQRLLFSYAEASMEKGLSGTLTGQEWKNIMLAGDRLQHSKIFIDDSSVVTPAEILSKCRRLKSSEGRLDLVMIDYIQLMGSEMPTTGDFNRQQEVASITRALKIMAKELDVPVIALSQLRRIQTKEAQLSDLRESGAIEQDADIVMFINRPDVGASREDIAAGKVVKGAADLVIAKHRNGPTGRIQLRFIGESTKFIDVDAQGVSDEEPQYIKKKPDFVAAEDADVPMPEPTPPDDLPFD